MELVSKDAQLNVFGGGVRNQPFPPKLVFMALQTALRSETSINPVTAMIETPKLIVV